DVEITHKMLQTERSSELNPVDAHYRALGMTLTEVDASSAEFTRIQEYIKLTHAPTHRQYKLHVDAVHALHKLEPSHSIEEKDPSLLFDALNNHQNYIREDGVKMPKGTLVPTDAEGGSLLYNEYVVYRTDQVRLRYAVTVTFEFN
ncbi:hypothetical protein DYB30_010949, partial [Aphanomyces astaci]